MWAESAPRGPRAQLPRLQGGRPRALVTAVTAACPSLFRNQCTPLLLAATSGALDTIRYLLSLGANWRKTDTKGNNIIHLSVLSFHTEVLKHIIALSIPELPVWATLVGEYPAQPAAAWVTMAWVTAAWVTSSLGHPGPGTSGRWEIEGILDMPPGLQQWTIRDVLLRPQIQIIRSYISCVLLFLN